jgi:hypothetical protein
MILEEIAFRKPKAIFVDILFLDERPNDEAESMKAFLRTMYRRSHPDCGSPPREFCVPIYFAKAPGTRFRADLLDPRCDDPGGRHPPEGLPEECDYLMRRLLPVPKQPERGILRSYPAKEHGELTAAFALLKLPGLSSKWTNEELKRLSIAATDMEILWGSTPHPHNQDWMKVTDDDGRKVACPTMDHSIVGRLWRPLRHPRTAFWQSCPYAATVPVENLVYRTGVENENDDERRRKVDELIEGKVVFYGTSLVGAGDIIDPPGQSTLAGVYMHAMALDNLLTLGPDYLRRTSKTWQWVIHIVAITFLAATFAWYWSVRRRTAPLSRPGGTLLRFGLRLFYPLATFVVLLFYGLLLTRVFNIAPNDWVGIAGYWIGFSLASAADLASFLWKLEKHVVWLRNKTMLAWDRLLLWGPQVAARFGRISRRLFAAR